MVSDSSDVERVRLDIDGPIATITSGPPQQAQCALPGDDSPPGRPDRASAARQRGARARAARRRPRLLRRRRPRPRGPVQIRPARPADPHAHRLSARRDRHADAAQAGGRHRSGLCRAAPASTWRWPATSASADPKAKYGAVYVTRGLGGGSTYLLPRYVGLGRATEMLLLGRFIEMEEAQRLGLVTEVVPPRTAREAAPSSSPHKLAKGPTQAYGAIKNARNQGLGLDPVKGFEAQILANVELMFHKDAREGPRAFKEGREPNFTAEWIDLQYDPLQALRVKARGDRCEARSQQFSFMEPPCRTPPVIISFNTNAATGSRPSPSTAPEKLNAFNDAMVMRLAERAARIRHRRGGGRGGPARRGPRLLQRRGRASAPASQRGGLEEARRFAGLGRARRRPLHPRDQLEAGHRRAARLRGRPRPGHGAGKRDGRCRGGHAIPGDRDLARPGRLALLGAAEFPRRRLRSPPRSAITGRFFTAEEALAAGIIDRVAPKGRARGAGL